MQSNGNSQQFQENIDCDCNMHEQLCHTRTFQDIQTYSTKFVNIRMVNLCHEAYFWCGHRILFR